MWLSKSLQFSGSSIISISVSRVLKRAWYIYFGHSSGLVAVSLTVHILALEGRLSSDFLANLVRSY